MKKILFLISVFIIFFTSNCEKDSFAKKDFHGIAVIDISSEFDGNWDYHVIGYEDHYLIKATDNNLPEIVVYYSAADNAYASIFFDEEGLPYEMIAKNNLGEDFVFLFDNYENNKVDIAIVYPNGDLGIFRKIEFKLEGLDELKSTSEVFATTVNWSTVVRWTGRVVKGIPCAISAVSSVSSAGATLPLTAWVCGNYLLGLSADIMEDSGISNGYTDFVNNWGAVGAMSSCGGNVNVTSCLIGIGGEAIIAFADHLEVQEQREEEIRLGQGALESGYGDVKITLTWDNAADVDLIVVDAFGYQIDWYTPYSPSGGVLDFDDRDGYGPENIYWKEQAPDGNYSVYVHHYYGPSPANYRVLVSAFGFIKIFSGIIYDDEVVHITDFDQNGLKTTLKSGKQITICIHSAKK